MKNIIISCYTKGIASAMMALTLIILALLVYIGKKG